MATSPVYMLKILNWSCQQVWYQYFISVSTQITQYQVVLYFLQSSNTCIQSVLYPDLEKLIKLQGGQLVRPMASSTEASSSQEDVSTVIYFSEINGYLTQLLIICVLKPSLNDSEIKIALGRFVCQVSKSVMEADLSLFTDPTCSSSCRKKDEKKRLSNDILYRCGIGIALRVLILVMVL